jgi:hypothetical protein
VKAIGEEKHRQTPDAAALVAQLQWLPLAISQVGAYIPQTVTPINQYLSMILQGKRRWEILQVSDSDRHRQPDVPNSILETRRISIEPIKKESQVAYAILNTIAYIDNRNIQFEILIKAGQSAFEGWSKTECMSDSGSSGDSGNIHNSKHMTKFTRNIRTATPESRNTSYSTANRVFIS